MFCQIYKWSAILAVVTLLYCMEICLTAPYFKPNTPMGTEICNLHNVDTIKMWALKMSTALVGKQEWHLHSQCPALCPVHTVNMDRNWRCVLFTFCSTTTNYIVHISQTGWSNRLLPTFWAQSVTFGALPDSTLVHLICVTTACPHTCSVISHNIVTWDNCTRQVYDKYVIFSIHRLNI